MKNPPHYIPHASRLRARRFAKPSMSSDEPCSSSSNAQMTDFIPLIDQSDIPENFNRKIILLAGPGGTAFNKDFVLRTQKALKAVNTAVVRIGDGSTDLTENEMAILFNEIANTDTPITLFLQCHGEMRFNRHVILLNQKMPIESEKFISDLSQNLSGKTIDIFSTACYGRTMAIYVYDKLPKGSTYVALNDKQVPGKTIENLIAHLEERFHSNIDRTAQALLMLYLSNALSGFRSEPSLASSEYAINIIKKLNSQLGKKFSESEISLIRKNLFIFASDDRIQAAIKEIENSNYIAANNLGLALAVCLAASGAFKQPFDHEIKSFQLQYDEKEKYKM